MISIQNFELILPERSAVEFFIHGEWNKNKQKKKKKKNEKPEKCMNFNI